MNDKNATSKYDVASYSAVGKRKNNEDSYITAEINSSFLAVVADGLGGYAGGELASQTLVSSMAELLQHCPFSEDGIDDAVVEANREILALRDGNDGPKSTLAMLWIQGGVAYAVNVGDSRIYQFRDGEIVFQSTDHSIPQLAVQVGEIRLEDIRTHKDRNKITRCMGNDRYVSPNIVKLQVKAGDRFLLCSDGFWEPVTEEDMISAAEVSSSAEAWLKKMNTIAYNNEKDNHTAIVIMSGR